MVIAALPYPPGEDIGPHGSFPSAPARHPSANRQAPQAGRRSFATRDRHDRGGSLLPRSRPTASRRRKGDRRGQDNLQVPLRLAPAMRRIGPLLVAFFLGLAIAAITSGLIPSLRQSALK